MTRKHRLTAALAASLGLLSGWAAAGVPTDEGRLAPWVDRRIRDWQPTKEERHFDEIGWARDIRDALRLSRESGRPVFLFTYDGADMATFRC